MKKIFLIPLLCLFFLCSCTSKSAKTTDVQTTDSLKLSYAQGFAIKYFPDYKEVIVYSPWVKGTVYARYYLVKDASVKTPADGTKVQVPLRTLVATSVTHFEFLGLLGQVQTVVGVCSPRIIYNKEINKRFGEGRIADLGDAFTINVEKTLQLKPGAVMMSGYNQNDPYA